MLKRDIALVAVVLIFAMIIAGCTELTDVVNGRGERVTLMPVQATTPAPAGTPVPTSMTTPTATPAPTTTPSPTPTPTPTPTPEPSPTPSATPTPSPTPTPTPTPTPMPTPEPAPIQNDTRVTGGMNIVPPIGIWDHYLLYDEKVGNDEFYLVHLYDIRSGEERTIATGNVRSYGCIGGEADSGTVGLIFGDMYRIMLYDINSRGYVPIISGSSQPYRSPCIDGGHLMYINSDDPQNQAFVNIYDYDVVSKTLNRLMAAPDPNDLRHSGVNIVWWFRNGDLRKVALLRNWFDAGFSIISPSDVVSDHPRVSGNKVVYHCTAGGTGYINLYNIDTGTTERVTSTGSQSVCDINGDRIVYDDNRDGNWNIYMTDRATGQEIRLTNEPHDQTSPMIWGNYVAYIDNRNGSPDIYVLTIG